MAGALGAIISLPNPAGKIVEIEGLMFIQRWIRNILWVLTCISGPSLTLCVWCRGLNPGLSYVAGHPGFSLGSSLHWTFLGVFFFFAIIWRVSYEAGRDDTHALAIDLDRCDVLLETQVGGCFPFPWSVRLVSSLGLDFCEKQLRINGMLLPCCWRTLRVGPWI